MIYKKIKIPIYDKYLHLIVSDDLEIDKKEIKQKFDIDLERTDFGGIAIENRGFLMMILNNKVLKPDWYKNSTIAHEAFHITNFIMRRIGLHPDVDNDEAQAYLLSFLVEEIHKKLK